MDQLPRAKAVVAQAANLMKVAITGNDVDEVIRQADRMLQELRTGDLFVFADISSFFCVHAIFRSTRKRPFRLFGILHLEIFFAQVKYYNDSKNIVGVFSPLRMQTGKEEAKVVDGRIFCAYPMQSTFHV